MKKSIRLKAAVAAALWHALASCLVAGAAAYLVFRIWYPDGLYLIASGGALFLILIAVDVVCGPALTLVLYNPAKSRRLWLIDISLIVLIQAAALLYGLQQVAAARPVYLGFEGDRFRLVQAMDVDHNTLVEAPAALARKPSLRGPEPLGVRLALPTDADYLSSVRLSLQGFHPSFRPHRWMPYSEQRSQVLSVAQPLSALAAKSESHRQEVTARLRKLNEPESKLVYVPLVRDLVTDWVVVLRKDDASPIAYWHLDGW